MPLITLTSDYGTSDHYSAALRIAGMKPPFPRILDITHEIDLNEIAQAAFTVSAVFRDCPEGSVHIIAVASDEGEPMLFEFEKHFFICADNGVMSLVANNATKKLKAYRILNARKTSFAAKNIFMPVALSLIAGAPPEKLAEPISVFKIWLYNQPKIEENRITASVTKKDKNGNLMTNFEKSIFDEVCRGRKYFVSFAREKIYNISQNYAEVSPGECGVLFNDLGLLEIFINRGNASELLGLNFNSQIRVDFFEGL
jgi:S-adenosylmethionine hydrolase